MQRSITVGGFASLHNPQTAPKLVPRANFLFQFIFLPERSNIEAGRGEDAIPVIADVFSWTGRGRALAAPHSGILGKGFVSVWGFEVGSLQWDPKRGWDVLRGVFQ